jgi:hypothetical protein
MRRTRHHIRVGIIGANKRTLWWGALFEDIDPVSFAAMDPVAYNHMTYYDRAELQVPRVREFRLTRLYDPDTERAQRTAAAFRKPPEVCRTLDGLAEDVNLVFVANESGDGSGNLHRVEAAIRKGIPVFIDRPLACTVAETKAILSLGRRRNVPVLSCSHLRMLPHAVRFRKRFAEIGAVDQGLIQGMGPNPAQMFDAIDLAQLLFSGEFSGRVKRVWSMGRWPLEILHMRYARVPARVLQGVIVNSDPQGVHSAFWAKTVGNRHHLDSPPFDAFVQTEGGIKVMEAVRQMLKTSRPPIPYSALVESVAIAEAGRLAYAKRSPVDVESVR